jgi:hypothetical protein
MTGRLVAGLALALFAVAAATAGILQLLGHPVHAGAAPLFGQWLPHVGPGTPLAVAVAALVCRYGPAAAERLPWRRLLAVSYLTAVLWTLSLALIDGWQRGVAGRLTTHPEYLTEVPGVTSVPAMLRGFAGRILDGRPDSWTTHVAGHPPGALLVFVGLDRLGLSGGAWAALFCVAVGGLTAVAVPATVRLLDSERAGRAAAIWVGVSADGLFAGVTATGVALLAYGVVRRSFPAAFAAGLLLAGGAYLSYGLVLMAALAVAVLAAAPAPRRTAWWAVAGAALVVAAFTAAGFDWLTGYHLVGRRYYQGLAAHRPYTYWVWANLAILAVAAGPAAAVILRRAAPRLSRRPGSGGRWILPLAAVAAILAADLSGYSKAEVERIWLPFTVWLMAGAALLPEPSRRRWLIAQAAVALAVNHIVLTVW